MPEYSPIIPDITDDDIRWVCEQMGLNDFDAPRRTFLTSKSTLDVSACPGSGKTTLVVAKLAILARKWPHQTKGVCVLSHTNVARERIQLRLGSTTIGNRLFEHPHYIDTIHGFVNRFLAIPWLISQGIFSPMIDDAITTSYRRRFLSYSEFCSLQSFLEKKFTSFDKLRISSRDKSFLFPAGPTSQSYMMAKRAIEGAARAGYFCFDEMFVWANALIDDFPDVACWLRKRFPIVFIDEMQDTSDVQCALLEKIFPHAATDSVVQRVGDPNQAIYDGPDTSQEAGTAYPCPTYTLTIPNSYRFGSVVAGLSSPFAVTAVGSAGLVGVGPKPIAQVAANCPNAIFVFPDNNTAGVLDAYGRHVLSVFGDEVLKDHKHPVTAVGGIHYDEPNVSAGHKQYPKTVPHYWNGYEGQAARKEACPKFLVQYIRRAHLAMKSGNEFAPSVDEIAAGIYRLAQNIGQPDARLNKGKPHRSIVTFLADNKEIRNVYRSSLLKCLTGCVPNNDSDWAEEQRNLVLIAKALCEGQVNETGARDFLSWVDDSASQQAGDSTAQRPVGQNTYRVMEAGRCVDVKLGSIHSVKGQECLAMLLLSTFWKKHSSARMLPWLLGQKMNANGSGVDDCKRLLQTYVAMTRPTHLLCLAIPRLALGDGASCQQNIRTLIDRGWRIAEIENGAERWIS